MKLNAIFLIFLLTLAPISHVAPKQTQIEVPEYVVPGVYFYYNGTMAKNVTPTCLLKMRGYAYAFEYNFTVLSVNASNGEVTVHKDLKAYNDTELVYHFQHKQLYDLPRLHFGGFFILPDYLNDTKVLEMMIGGLAFAVPVNTTYSFEKISYESILGNLTAIRVNVSGWTKMKLSDKKVHWDNVTGYLVFWNEGLLLETTLRYINATVIYNTTGFRTMQMERVGGLALKLVATNIKKIIQKAVEEKKTWRIPMELVAIIVTIAVVILPCILLRRRR